nr:MAG TPA: hypothetical protein [Caudoviricetes sp.]
MPVGLGYTLSFFNLKVDILAEIKGLRRSFSRAVNFS